MKKYIFSRTTAQNYKTTTKCNFLKLSLKKSVIHKHTTENHQQVKNPIQTISAMWFIHINLFQTRSMWLDGIDRKH